MNERCKIIEIIESLSLQLKKIINQEKKLKECLEAKKLEVYRKEADKLEDTINKQDKFKDWLNKGENINCLLENFDISVAEQIIDWLDQGKIVSAKRKDEKSVWIANYIVKIAILKLFKCNKSTMGFFGDNYKYYDKIPLKFSNWQEEDFHRQKIRVAPGAIVRKGSYIGENCVLMPCFINVGAHVGNNTMIDTFATVGSCAQIGSNVHISGGVGIGGVLEPLQSTPTIIEDNCFIGARSEIVEGVVVKKNSVISMGVYIGASTKIMDRCTGKVYQKEVPQNSVVVPGFYTKEGDHCSTYCAVIIKQVDDKTLSKVCINEILRDLQDQ